MRGVKFAIFGLLALGSTAVSAAECPGNPDALGTSRTIVVDPTEHPRIGGLQYRESLPLEDHEVVLTFDDGPLPPYSNRVLEILASECVKANYFMVGKMARSFPDVVRRVRDAGHTIGTHSESHPLTFHKMSVERAAQEINEGIASVASALGDGTMPAPFFRVPGLLRSDAVERYLASQRLMTWSIDFPADDWMKISPAQVYARALSRIEANHKGVLLLHDIHERTVQALPGLLRELKRRGYRIVHVVVATPDLPKTETDPREWIVHPHQIWTPVPVFADTETEPELPAPSPKSFGIADLDDVRSLVRDVAPRVHVALARGQVPLPPVPIWPRQADAPVAVSSSFARPLLPVPSPQTFGLPGNTPAPAGAQHKAAAPVVMQHKAGLDVVPKSNATVLDIRQLITAGMYDEGAADPALPPLTPGPLATANMPHGAFP
jgi:peptidoglycan-N-acetylglucosamine deacetylase